MEIIFSFFKNIPKNLLLPGALGCTGLILIIYGLITYSKPNTSQQEIAQPQQIPTIVPVKTVKNIFVDIEGGVMKSGVYSLVADSRVQDALIAAGGLSVNADRDYVTKHVNLAAKLTDGEKLYIFRIGESISPQNNLSATSQTSVDGSSVININTATASDLDGLPGVGAVTAGKIISSRPYASVDELLSKKVVSKSIFDKIKGFISVE